MDCLQRLQKGERPGLTITASCRDKQRYDSLRIDVHNTEVPEGQLHCRCKRLEFQCHRCLLAHLMLHRKWELVLRQMGIDRRYPEDAFPCAAVHSPSRAGSRCREAHPGREQVMAAEWFAYAARAGV